MSVSKMGHVHTRPITRLLTSNRLQIIPNKALSPLRITSTTSACSCHLHYYPHSSTSTSNPRRAIIKSNSSAKLQTTIFDHRSQPSSFVLQPLAFSLHQQARTLQTDSPQNVTARTPRTDSVSTFSDTTAVADVISHDKSIFGGDMGVTSSHEYLEDQDVCRQLQEEQFSDHHVAFSSKTAFELARSTLFFFLFQYKIFTDRSEEFMRLLKTVLGERLSEKILKKMMYEQYVAGETTEEIRHVVNRLGKEGIGPLIAVPIEDDIGHSHSPTYDYEDVLNSNCAKILGCMDLCMNVAGSDPMFQLRVTALMSPTLIATLSAACAMTESGDEDALSLASVKTLVQGIKGETMDFPQTEEWDKVDAHKGELLQVMDRVRQITNKISELEIVAMVDAEYTYFNPAIRHLTFAMMEICNKKKPLVFHTYQAYLKTGYPHLSSDLQLSKSRGICFGVKLVRGAYMVKEKKRAASGHPDPVCESYDSTGKMYMRCLDELMEAASEDKDRIRFIVATHNEDSVRHAFKRMDYLGLPHNSKAVLFGQLYGMADHVSYTLGKKGCKVVKSLPYGCVDDTIPYLARRAHENRSIFDNVRKEKQMVKRALWDRVLRRN